MQKNPYQSPQSADKLPSPIGSWWALPSIGRTVGVIAVVFISSLLGLFGTFFVVDHINQNFEGPRPQDRTGRQEWAKQHEWQLAPGIIGGLAIGGLAGWSVFSVLLSNRDLPKK